MSDFAKRVGVPYATLRKWELHGTTPSAPTLKRAIQALRVPEWRILEDWLLSGQNPPSWLTGNAPVPPTEPEEDDFQQQERREAAHEAELAKRREREARKRRGPPPPIPWLAIEMLAQRATEAIKRGDTEEIARLADEFRLLTLCADCPHRAPPAPVKGSPQPQPVSF